ncbi:MAG TPA: SapB/AmfS family lanthipeptide [Streptomyces sp.]|nr:SapB/AmfS family lanthipeptide [Streptomyces sp.]HZG03131.1 SapB/AmfS family lanthipeptide [Streptomyces sp.]
MRELGLYDLQELQSEEESVTDGRTVGDSTHSVLCDPLSVMSLIVCG